MQNRIEAYHQELEGMSKEYLRRLEVIEGLSADYESIFYIDLDADTIQTYQLSDRLDGHFDSSSRIERFSDFVSNYSSDWVCPEDRERFCEFLSAEELRGKLSDARICDLDYRITVDGRSEYFQLHAINGGKPNQIILGARSVDDYIRRSIKQRQVLESALHQANTAMIAKDTFLANMSHDMRTPMNAILGFTALAKKHLDADSRAGEYLDMIELAGNQLLQLVNEVLEIARMEAGKVNLEENNCNLHDIARDVYDEYCPHAAAKNIRLSLETDAVATPEIIADDGRLRHLLSILTDNAVKYTQPGGYAELRIEELEAGGAGYGSYRFSVIDNGPGIGKDFLSRLFVPFEREQNTTSSRVPGTGLGLSIAKSICELMGSKLEVSTELGKGSCFSSVFTFRVREPEAESGQQRSVDTNMAKILLVEDNELNIEIERELLESEGFAVDVAENGKIAVDILAHSKPGEYMMVFMDIQMPVMDGYEATRSIRALPDPALAHIPVVAVSANAYDEDKRKASESGMNDHISKPVSIAQLVNAINVFCGH